MDCFVICVTSKISLKEFFFFKYVLITLIFNTPDCKFKTLQHYNNVTFRAGILVVGYNQKYYLAYWFRWSGITDS